VLAKTETIWYEKMFLATISYKQIQIGIADMIRYPVCWLFLLSPLLSLEQRITHQTVCYML